MLDAKYSLVKASFFRSDLIVDVICTGLNLAIVEVFSRTVPSLLKISGY